MLKPRPWQLALAALVAVATFALSTGVGPPSVHADVLDLDADTLFILDGEDVEITVIAEDFVIGDATDEIVISVSDGVLEAESCETDAADCLADVDDTSDPDDEVEVDANAINTDLIADEITIILTLTADCSNDDPEIITVTVSQLDGPDQEIEIVCITEPNVVIEKAVELSEDSDLDDDDFTFEYSGSDDVCWLDDGGAPELVQNDDQFDLDDGDSVELFCDTGSGFRIEEDLDDDDFDLDISCDVSDLDDDDDAEDVADVNSDSVDIDLEDPGDSSNLDVDVVCTFTNSEEGIDDPEPETDGTTGGTPVSGTIPVSGAVIGNLTVTASPSTLPTCSGSALVTVIVSTPGGVGIANEPVVVNSSQGGSFAPGSTSTTGSAGQAVFVYTAPALDGTTTISASAAGLVRETNVNIECAMVALPPGAPIDSQEIGVILPPSAGDGVWWARTWSPGERQRWPDCWPWR
ncbi:MAG: hypothetical protein GEU75_14075 [Dehalococcoidia bacterium]|nr:hypothetical protein [Dehalococcoidia bacterium]